MTLSNYKGKLKWIKTHVSKIFIITGQTATGKTDLALKLAKKYKGELINFDSRQIYKYLDIITGKDIAKNAEFKKIEKKFDYDIGYYNLKTENQSPTSRIWLCDIVAPNKYFSSFAYQYCSLKVIKKILKKGETPILVGGTYLYLRHLLYNIETEKIEPDFELRENLKNKNIKELQHILNTLDHKIIDKFNNSELNNPQRLVRKIEISKYYLAHGIKKNVSTAKDKIVLNKKLGIKHLKIKYIGLRFSNKSKLKLNIEKRVEKRMTKGAIDEVKKILKMGYTENDPGLKTIGYSQIIKYLKGSLTKDEATKEWINKEIQYAKRQYTFMKKDKEIKWKEI